MPHPTLLLLGLTPWRGDFEHMASTVLIYDQRQGTYYSSPLEVPPTADAAEIRVIGLSQDQLKDLNVVITIGFDVSGDFAGVPRGRSLDGFTFSLLSRDGINPPEPGQPIATVSSDGGLPRATTNLPVWVGGERYRLDLSGRDIGGACNHFVVSMPGAMAARFTILTVA